MKLLSLTTILFFIVIITCYFTLFTFAQHQQQQTPQPQLQQDENNIVYFTLTAGHHDDYFNTNFDGYVTCRQQSGCPQSDVLTILVTNTMEDTKPKFVTINTFLEDGTSFSEAPLNQTITRGVPSKLPMKTFHSLSYGETVYFSGHLEWHDIALSNTTFIEIGYGATYELAIKQTYQQYFYPHLVQTDDVFQSLEYRTNNDPHDYEFTLYLQTYELITNSFSLRPYGGIFPNNPKCQIDHLNVNVTIVYDINDIYNKFPTYLLTIPTNHDLQFQSYKESTQVQISCTGFIHNSGDINRGVVVLTHNVKNNFIGITTITRMGKLLRSQTPNMAINDGTVSIALPDYYSFSISGKNSKGESKTFSYHTVHVELSSPQLTFPSNKTFHLYLDGIAGGAIILSRWSLTVRDSNGNDLPYTTTDKLKVAWYADGKVARFDTWTIGLTKEMLSRYDPTKGARLTISYVLSFDPTINLPSVLIPTAMVGIEQEIHWINFSSKSRVTTYEFITPVLSRKAMVTSENFQFHAIDLSHDNNDSHHFIMNSLDDNNNSNDDDKHSPYYIGQQKLFGFNMTIANVQYLDFERPSHFYIRIPVREFNFAGDFSTCTLNDEPIYIVNPLNPSEQLKTTNAQVLMFNHTLQPSVNYDLLCPNAFLTNSSNSNADRHKNKDIIVQFLAESSSPTINSYDLVASTFVNFGHPEHDSGTTFAIVTMVSLSLAFALIIGWIIIDRRRKNAAAKNVNNDRDITTTTDNNDNDTNDIHSPAQSPTPGQYQQFSDQQ